MAKKRDNIPRLFVRKGATLRRIYRLAREQFTAADLQKYTESAKGISMGQVLAELEEAHWRECRKKKPTPR